MYRADAQTQALARADLNLPSGDAPQGSGFRWKTAARFSSKLKGTASRAGHPGLQGVRVTQIQVHNKPGNYDYSVVYLGRWPMRISASVSPKEKRPMRGACGRRITLPGNERTFVVTPILSLLVCWSCNGLQA